VKGDPLARAVVPEFPGFMVLPLFMLTTLLVAVLSRKGLN
jgi:hypothetical protein